MTYEYACAGCGHEWEAEQSIKDAPLKKCPQCGKQQAKRQISRGTGFILKGGGWYADGYGSSKGGGDAGGGDKTSSATSAPVAGSPAASTESKGSGADSKSGGDTKTSSEPSGSDSTPKKTAKGKTAAA